MRGQRGFPAGRTVPEGLWVEGPWQEHLTHVSRLPALSRKGMLLPSLGDSGEGFTCWQIPPEPHQSEFLPVNSHQYCVPATYGFRLGAGERRTL